MLNNNLILSLNNHINITSPNQSVEPSIPNFKYEEIIYKFYNKKIAFTYKNLHGLTNEVFLIETFRNNKNNECDTKPNKIILRVYGKASVFINRDSEISIINSTNQKGICASIYESSTEYRIEEYLEGHYQSNNFILTENIEEFICCLIDFNLIEVYEFKKINNLKLRISFLNSYDNLNESKFNGYFLMNILNSACEYLENEINSFTSNEKIKKIMKILDVLQNFEEIYKKYIPDHGILSISHNDLHKGNIMYKLQTNNEKDERLKSNSKSSLNSIDETLTSLSLSKSKLKFKFLDFEFSNLNLIGIDMVNFLIELSFDYSSFPSFEFSRIDYERNYEIYLKYIVKMIEKLKKDNVFIDFSVVESISKKEYFYKLNILSSLFWVVVESFFIVNDYNTFDYIEYCIKRIEIIEENCQFLKYI